MRDPRWFLLWLFAGCNNITGSDASEVPVVTDAALDDTAVAEPERPLAGGISIAKVSLWQGVESVLVQDRKAPTTTEMPVIIGRQGVLRVFLEPEPTFDTRQVTAILVIGSVGAEDTVFEQSLRVTGGSTPGDLDSTINFELSADLVKRTTWFDLRIVEQTAEGPGGGAERDTTWLSEETGGLDAQLTDDLTIVLIPIRYNADGSGRLPDTGPAQTQRIADLVMGVYPASTVTVRVDEPLDWPRRIAPFDSSDWTDVLDELINLRARTNEAPNTYYYGMFNPEDTLNQFCQSGCILGLSYLAYRAEPFFRASVGIGYPGTVASETLVHEVGHAHGREHAPCGLYGQASDRDYPYAGAGLGSWGNDVLTGELFDPNRNVDLMSYCSPIWISDYSFYALYERMQEVAGENRAAPVSRSALKLGGDGTSTMRAPVRFTSTEGAPRVTVDLFDRAGARTGQATAAFFGYDHVPGGLVVLDEELPPGWTATVVP